jgi:hypothetical protein
MFRLPQSWRCRDNIPHNTSAHAVRGAVQSQTIYLYLLVSTKDTMEETKQCPIKRPFSVAMRNALFYSAHIKTIRKDKNDNPSICNDARLSFSPGL